MPEELKAFLKSLGVNPDDVKSVKMAKVKADPEAVLGNLREMLEKDLKGMSDTSRAMKHADEVLDNFADLTPEQVRALTVRDFQTVIIAASSTIQDFLKSLPLTDSDRLGILANVNAALVLEQTDKLALIGKMRQMGDEMGLFGNRGE